MARSAENLGYLVHKMAKNCIKMTKIRVFFCKSDLISSRFFAIAIAMAIGQNIYLCLLTIEVE